MFDWGAGIVTLRSAANGKYVGYNGPNFVNDQVQPNGWYVQQQFALEAQTDGTYLLRYAGNETREPWWSNPVYLGPTDDDGTLGLVAKDEAAHFAKDVVRSGTEEAVAAVKGKDAAVVVVGSHAGDQRPRERRPRGHGLAPSQEALVKAVRAANPKTVVVVENSYPTTLGALQKEVPALLWTTHAGQETGNALADVLFGDVNPAGRLTQTWYELGGRPARTSWTTTSSSTTAPTSTSRATRSTRSATGSRTPPSATGSCRRVDGRIRGSRRRDEHR